MSSFIKKITVHPLFFFLICFAFLLIKAPRLELYFIHVDIAAFLIGSTQLIKNGLIPFIDTYPIGGPFSIYVISFFYWIYSNLVIFSIAFSFFHSVSLLILSVLLRRYLPLLPSILLPLILGSMISSLYRFWMWFFYLLIILILSSQYSQQKKIIMSSLMGSIATMFSFEQGLTLIFITSIAILSDLLTKRDIKKFLKSASLAIIIFISMPIIWICTMEVFQSGSGLGYIEFVYSSMTKYVSYVSHPEIISYSLFEIFYALTFIIGIIFCLRTKYIEGGSIDPVLLYSTISLAPLSFYYLTQNSYSHYEPMLPIAILLLPTELIDTNQLSESQIS